MNLLGIVEELERSVACERRSFLEKGNCMCKDHEAGKNLGLFAKG